MKMLYSVAPNCKPFWFALNKMGAGLCLIAAVMSPQAFSEPSDEDEISALILAMNQAVSEKSLENLLPLFDEGAIRLDLFSAHKYGDSNPKGAAVRNADLTKRWKSVGPLLFGMSKRYERKVASVDINVDGDMAMAWVELTTEMLATAEGAKPSQNHFFESLLLRRTNGDWKIVMASNNRQD